MAFRLKFDIAGRERHRIGVVGHRHSRRAVTLRPLRDVDDIGAARWLGWLNDARVARHLEGRRRWTPVRLRRWVLRHHAAPRTHLYAICLVGDPVGTLKLEEVMPRAWANLGLMIGEPAAWNQGFGTRAIRQACLIAKRAGVLGVWAGIRTEHMASRRTFAKAGFHQVGAGDKDGLWRLVGAGRLVVARRFR